MPRLLQFHKDLTVLDQAVSIATVRAAVEAWEAQGVSVDLEECRMMLDEACGTTEAFAQFWNLGSNEDAAVDAMLGDLKLFVGEYRAIAGQ